MEALVSQAGDRRLLSCLVVVSSQAADLQVQVTRQPQKKPDPSQPSLFGNIFTDHMLIVEWTKETGWSSPGIQPFQNLPLHPACWALNYLQVAPAAPVTHPAASLLCT